METILVVGGTLNLLRAMRENDCDQLVFSSTCSVYGTPASVPIAETHPCAPINPYGRGKLMMENIMAEYSAAYGLKYVALRYFNAAGADPGAEVGEDHNPETHLIPLVLDVAAGLRAEIKVFGTDYPTPDAARRAGDPLMLVGSVEKAKRLLGWRPRWEDLADIVSSAWNWRRNRFGD